MQFLPNALILVCGLSAWCGLSAETNRPAAASPRPLDYTIVVTGEELLRGVYPDAHTCFITRSLHLLGAHCVGSMTVDDREEDIRQVLAFATQKASLVIVTGGLGPTVNDVTRGAISAFTGIALAEHPEVLAELERRFQQPRDQLRPNLRRQTLVPVQGAYLPNPHGTAVGLVFEKNGAVIVSLPGPPRELQPMVNNELIPYLRRKFGVRPPGSFLTLRFVGVGQSQIDQTLSQRVPMPPGLLVSSLFEAGRVDFTFALPGDGPEDRARLQQLESSVRGCLGEYIYATGDASLEQTVVAEFRKRGGKLAVVEAGSGGHLGASLDNVEGIGQVLAAAWAAPSDEQMSRIVEIPPADWQRIEPGPARLRGLGEAARKLARCDWVVAISRAERTTNAAPFVWLGVGSPAGGWDIQRVPAQGRGETAHAALTTQLLDRLRRHFAGAESPEPARTRP